MAVPRRHEKQKGAAVRFRIFQMSKFKQNLTNWGVGGLFFKRTLRDRLLPLTVGQARSR
jgi:hypothetical protein